MTLGERRRSAVIFYTADAGLVDFAHDPSPPHPPVPVSVLVDAGDDVDFQIF